MQNNIFSGTPNGVQPIKKTMSQGMSSSKIRKQGREKNEPPTRVWCNSWCQDHPTWPIGGFNLAENTLVIGDHHPIPMSGNNTYSIWNHQPGYFRNTGAHIQGWLLNHPSLSFQSTPIPNQPYTSCPILDTRQEGKSSTRQQFAKIHPSKCLLIKPMLTQLGHEECLYHIWVNLMGIPSQYTSWLVGIPKKPCSLRNPPDFPTRSTGVNGILNGSTCFAVKRRSLQACSDLWNSLGFPRNPGRGGMTREMTRWKGSSTHLISFKCLSSLVALWYFKIAVENHLE